MGLPGLRTHRKFRRLVALLRIPEAHALGHLQMLWETSWDHLTPALGDETDVELAAGWVGEHGALAAALVSCGGEGPGFIDRGEDGRYLVHDYLEHAPRWVREKLRKRGELAAEGRSIEDLKREAGRKGAAARWASKDGKPAQVCQEKGSKPMADDGRSCPSPPLPSLPLNTEEAEASSCGEPAKAAPPPASPVLFEVPCVGTGPKTWSLTQAKLDEWTQAFPGLDVRAELRKAIQWLRDNPAKGKTARGMTAFFGRWLGNAQDRNPKPTTPFGGPHATRSPQHRAGVDAAYLAQLQERPTAAAPEADEELRGLWAGAPD